MHAAAAKLTSIRILLIDDHTVMRLGLRMLIENQQRLKVVGEASGRDRLTRARSGVSNPTLSCWISVCLAPTASH